MTFQTRSCARVSRQCNRPTAGRRWGVGITASAIAPGRSHALGAIRCCGASPVSARGVISSRTVKELFRKFSRDSSARGSGRHREGFDPLAGRQLAVGSKLKPSANSRACRCRRNHAELPGHRSAKGRPWTCTPETKRRLPQVDVDAGSWASNRFPSRPGGLPQGQTTAPVAVHCASATRRPP